MTLCPLLHTVRRGGLAVLNGREQEVWLARVKVERALHKVINGPFDTTELYGHTVDESDLVALLKLMDQGRSETRRPR